jgi:hypothetical protein
MPIAVKIAVVTACALVALGTIFWVMRRNSKARLDVVGQGGRAKGSAHHMSKKSSGSVEVLSNPAPGPRLTPKNQQKALVPMTGEVIAPKPPAEDGKKPGFWMRTGSGAASSKPAPAPSTKAETPPVVLTAVDPNLTTNSVPTTVAPPAPAPSPTPSPSTPSVNSLAAPLAAVTNSLTSLARDERSHVVAESQPQKNLGWTLAASPMPFVKPQVEDVVRPNPPEQATSREPTPENEVPSALATAVNSLLSGNPSGSVPVTPRVAVIPPISPAAGPADLSAPATDVAAASNVDGGIAQGNSEDPVLRSQPDPVALSGSPLAAPPVVMTQVTPSIPLVTARPADQRADDFVPLVGVSSEATEPVPLAPTFTGVAVPAESESDDLIFYDDDEFDNSDSDSEDGALEDGDEIDFREDVIRIHVRIDENGVQQITTMDMSSGAQQWTDKQSKKSNGTSGAKGSKGKKKKKKNKSKKK